MANVTEPGELLAAVNASAGALSHAMGITFTEVAAERVVATMPVEGNTQPYGLLHGGASCVLAETVASMGAALYAGGDRLALGIEINATHHRTVSEGRLTAVAIPLHLGRSFGTYDVAITDQIGRRICTSRVTCTFRDA